MLRLLIAYSGGGKTYRLKKEIASTDIKYTKVYVFERECYGEYSKMFNSSFVHILNENMDISFLKDEECNIYVDNENYTTEFLKKLIPIISGHKADITITFLGASDVPDIIFNMADEIWVGQIGLAEELDIEKKIRKELPSIPSECSFIYRIIHIYNNNIFIDMMDMISEGCHIERRKGEAIYNYEKNYHIVFFVRNLKIFDIDGVVYRFKELFIAE